MSWREFLHWQAYLRMEPPDEADNARTAAVLAQITNMAGRSLPNNERVKPEDFLGKTKKQTLEQQIAFMKGLGKNG